MILRARGELHALDGFLQILRHAYQPFRIVPELTEPLIAPAASQSSDTSTT